VVFYVYRLAYGFDKIKNEDGLLFDPPSLLSISPGGEVFKFIQYDVNLAHPPSRAP
jgi:hypothetical protein